MAHLPQQTEKISDYSQLFRARSVQRTTPQPKQFPVLPPQLLAVQHSVVVLLADLYTTTKQQQTCRQSLEPGMEQTSAEKA